MALNEFILHFMPNLRLLNVSFYQNQFINECDKRKKLNTRVPEFFLSDIKEIMFLIRDILLIKTVLVVQILKELPRVLYKSL